MENEKMQLDLDKIVKGVNVILDKFFDTYNVVYDYCKSLNYNDKEIYYALSACNGSLLLNSYIKNNLTSEEVDKFLEIMKKTYKEIIGQENEQ